MDKENFDDDFYGKIDKVIMQHYSEINKPYTIHSWSRSIGKATKQAELIAEKIKELGIKNVIITPMAGKLIVEGEVKTTWDIISMGIETKEALKRYRGKKVKLWIEEIEESLKIFKWRGKELITWSDIYNAIDGIETKKDGREFVKAANVFCDGDVEEWINSLLDYMCPDERIEDIRLMLGIKSNQQEEIE
jgi:hypothetical protein